MKTSSVRPETHFIFPTNPPFSPGCFLPLALARASDARERSVGPACSQATGGRSSRRDHRRLASHRDRTGRNGGDEPGSSGRNGISNTCAMVFLRRVFGRPLFGHGFKHRRGFCSPVGMQAQHSEAHTIPMRSMPSMSLLPSDGGIIASFLWSMLMCAELFLGATAPCASHQV